MTLREVTRIVIKLVEDASGCSVGVSEDASLKTLAALRIARVPGVASSSTVRESMDVIAYAIEVKP